jgi:hypothetical protein
MEADYAAAHALYVRGKKTEIQRIRQFTLILPSVTILCAEAAPYVWDLSKFWANADDAYKDRPEIKPVEWAPRPSVDVDNLNRLQRMCKSTDKEIVRQLAEGTLNGAVVSVVRHRERTRGGGYHGQHSR